MRENRAVDRLWNFDCEPHHSAHHKRVAGCRAGVDPDAFHLQVVADGVDPVLSPQARVLEATEGCHVAYRSIGIDPDRAGLNAR